MLSFDPSNSQFVLIGTSHYVSPPSLPDAPPHDPSFILQELPAVLNNLSKLRELLHNPEVAGIPYTNITVISDPTNRVDLSDRLIPAVNRAQDLLFVYYAGHGLIGHQSKKLYLGVNATTDHGADFNGFDFGELRLAMDSSRAKKRILILDCCFSGNALEGTSGTLSGLVDGQIAMNSTYSIASAPPNRLAIAEPGETYTAFTRELVEILENGTGGPEEFLTIDNIFQHLKTRIGLKPSLPEPRQAVHYDGASLIIAKNRKSGSLALQTQLESLYRLVNESTTKLGDSVDGLSARLATLESAKPNHIPTPEDREPASDGVRSDGPIIMRAQVRDKLREMSLNLQDWLSLEPSLQNAIVEYWTAVIAVRLMDGKFWIAQGALLTCWILVYASKFYISWSTVFATPVIILEFLSLIIAISYFWEAYRVSTLGQHNDYMVSEKMKYLPIHLLEHRELSILLNTIRGTIVAKVGDRPYLWRSGLSLVPYVVTYSASLAATIFFTVRWLIDLYGPNLTK